MRDSHRANSEMKRNFQGRKSFGKGQSTPSTFKGSRGVGKRGRGGASTGSPGFI